MPRFACRHRRDGHQANPSSPLSLIATSGPTAARSRRLRSAPAPRGLAVCVATQRSALRLRRSWLVALSGFCCGPRGAAIWHPLAGTISRRLAVLATKPIARRARRLSVPREGVPRGSPIERSQSRPRCFINSDRLPASETQNSKLSTRYCRRAPRLSAERSGRSVRGHRS